MLLVFVTFKTSGLQKLAFRAPKVLGTTRNMPLAVVHIVKSWTGYERAITVTQSSASVLNLQLVHASADA